MIILLKIETNRDVVSILMEISTMRIPMRTLVVVSILAVVFSPLWGASEEVSVQPDTRASSTASAGRADEMSAWSIDGGGGQSSGGGFALTAAIGQPDAGVLAQGGAVLAGGLWAGALDSGSIFFNGFESGDTSSWSSVIGGNP